MGQAQGQCWGRCWAARAASAAAPPAAAAVAAGHAGPASDGGSGAPPVAAGEATGSSVVSAAPGAVSDTPTDAALQAEEEVTRGEAAAAAAVAAAAARAERAAADKAKLEAAAAQTWVPVGTPEQAVALGNKVKLLMESPVAASQAAAAAYTLPDEQPAGRAPAAEVSRAGGGQGPTRGGRDAGKLSTAQLDTIIAEFQQQDAYKAAARRANLSSAPSDSRKTSSSSSSSTSDEGSEGGSEESSGESSSSSDEDSDEDSDSPEQRSDNKTDHAKGKRARHASDAECRPALTTLAVSALGRSKRNWLWVIELAADRVSYVTYHMLLFANLHIARVLEEGRPAPVVDRVCLTKIRWLFVTGRPRVHDPRPDMQATLHALEQHLGHAIAPVSGVGLSHILDAAIDELLVAFNNYDQFALHSHLAKYVRARFQLDRKAAATAIADKVLRPHGQPGFFRRLPASLDGTATLATWNARIRTLHARFLQCLDADRRPIGPRVAAWRREMLQAIDAANVATTTDWKYRSFNLAPTPSAGRKFICISNSAMTQLYALAKDAACNDRRDAMLAVPPRVPRHTVQEIDDAANLFREGIDSFFNRGDSNVLRHDNKRWVREDGELVHASHKVGRRLHPKNTKKKKEPPTLKPVKLTLTKAEGRWDLADIIRTNGLELHLVFRSKNWPTGAAGRPVPERQLPAAQRTATTDLDPRDLRRALVRARADGHAGPPRFTATDPGVTSPATTAFIDPSTGEFVSKTFSARRYRALAGRAATTARTARDRELFQLDPVIADYAELPLKGCDPAALLEATALRFRHHRLMHEAHSTRGKLKLAFLTRRRVASAIDKVVNFVRHDKTVELVAIGNMSRTFGLRGASNGAPIVKIERRAVVRGRNEGFQVFLVDEKCTSCKSWCCKGAQMRAMRTGNKMRTLPGGAQVKDTAHGILACQGCGKLWGRDPNACRNIGECVFAELHGMPRPAHLRSSAAGFV